MYIRKIEGARVVKLPDGTTLSRADLPGQDTRRWVASRKAKVVKAVRYGLITEEEAMSTYDLSPDELSSWQNAIDAFGQDGLKTRHCRKQR